MGNPSLGAGQARPGLSEPPHLCPGALLGPVVRSEKPRTQVCILSLFFLPLNGSWNSWALQGPVFCVWTWQSQLLGSSGRCRLPG